MSRAAVVRRTAPIVLLLASANACEPFTAPTPPITIELAQSSVEMISGLDIPPFREPKVMVGFTVHRNGYGGPVTLSGQAPAPISVSIYSVVLPNSVISAAASITVPPGTPIGDHVVTVTASAGKLGSVSASITVSTQPSSMSMPQSTVTVNRGAANTVSVIFQKDPSISIAVTASGVPAGVTIVAAAPVGGRVFLDISAAIDAPVQTVPVTVTAFGGGRMESRQLQLTVQSPPPKREIAFRVCRSQFIGTAQIRGTYAYANDGEVWTTVVPDQDDMIRFLATERVSFANTFTYFISLYNGGPTTRVIHATATELEEMQCASASDGPKRFTVTAAGAESHVLSLGTFRTSSGPPVSTYGAARPGPHDLIAIGDRAIAPGRQQLAIVRRGVDLADGATIALDFAAAEAVVLDSGTHTLTAPPSGYANATSRIHTSTTIALVRSQSGSQLSGRYWALPESLLLAGEIQSLLFEVGSFETATARGAVHYFRSAEALTPTFGPDLATPTTDVANQTISLPAQAEYPSLAGAGYTHVIDGRGTYHQVEVWQTVGFVGATPQTWTFTPPDLGRLLSVPPLSSAYATVGAASGSASLFFGGTPAAGAVVRWAFRRSGGFGWALPFPTGR